MPLRRLILPLLTILVLAVTVRAQETKTLVRQGDELYDQRVGLNLLYLADTYISLGQIEKARETLEYILTMEPEPDLIPETGEERVQARQRLEAKQFKKKK
jgi:Tfp pilus assembly protein PilF